MDGCLCKAFSRIQSATGSSLWNLRTNGSAEDKGELLKRCASGGEVGLSIAENIFDVVINTLAEVL